MELRGKQVLVVGAGMSGLASCHYLQKKGCKVLLADNKSREQLMKNKEVAAFVRKGGELLSDNMMPEQVTWDLAVVSPGVPLHIPLLNITRAANVPIIGEIELAYQEAKAPFIGVTGTNGKTTTTALIGHILKECGVDVLVGGNIGQPLVDIVGDFRGAYIVAELSSFQLESCISFRPQIAVYLNLTPDHLDRHGNMEQYGEAKERIFANQTSSDIAVLNSDDPLVAAAASRIASRLLWFSLHHRPKDGIYFEEERLHYLVAGEERYSFAAADIFIKGRHNIQNAMAAFLAAASLGLAPERIAQAIISFQGVEHRQEYVKEIGGVLYINDSKGTNPASTFQAIMAYERPMILLLGGRNKGSDFTELMQLVRQRVKLAVIYGEATGELKKAADSVGYHSYLIAGGFEDAVAQARQQARPGDVVMLSPACASWDSFNSFEERGRKFKELIG
jgi:UDP-N-acetylmuramoylalanine--D-glutamate ligase